MIVCFDRNNENDDNSCMYCKEFMHNAPSKDGWSMCKICKDLSTMSGADLDFRE